jgi:hypothetical protein
LLFYFTSEENIMVRIAIAGIVGGIVMFVWGAVGHMFLGVGEYGVKPMPNDEAVIACMKANIPDPGLYFSPAMDMSRTLSEEEQNAWMAKYEAGPNVFLVYRPVGVTPMSTRQLGIELLSNILAALVGAFILSFVQPSFFKRLIVATCIGMAAWLSINVSYYDWYRFPANFVASELIEQAIGWALSGAAMAMIVRARALN